MPNYRKKVTCFFYAHSAMMVVSGLKLGKEPIKKKSGDNCNDL